eukprot:7791204-Karenia_brevis.AAC.1
MHAGANRLCRRGWAAQYPTEDIKVKAHVDPSKVDDPAMRAHAVYNNKADEAAVWARSNVPGPSSQTLRAIAREEADMFKIAQFAAE